MWSTDQVQPGYSYPRQTPPQPPPLTVQPHQSQQQTSYTVSSSTPVPASPHSEMSKDEDLSTLPGPPPTSFRHDGYVWALDFMQQPIRARMCGFGDKDRRPISPPPCIRLIIMDPATMREIDPNTIDTSFFVLSVDLWDLAGAKEVNLVKHAQTSPSISTASTTAYPPTVTNLNPSPSHPVPQPYDVSKIPAYTQQNINAPIQNQAAPSPYGYYGSANGSGMNGHHPQVYANNEQYQYSDPRLGRQPSQSNGYSIPPFSSLPTTQSRTVNSPYHSDRRTLQDRQDVPSLQTTGMYTRNLIGSLSTSASLLRDEAGHLGIWFILQDLSVRTEGWFRLKATFFTIGETVRDSPSSNSNGITPQILTPPGGTAPVLATVFSKPFQVFSAKKFPGVIESTLLSRTFATQGIKIPIRKDPTSKGSRGRPDDEDEEGDYGDED